MKCRNSLLIEALKKANTYAKANNLDPSKLEDYFTGVMVVQDVYDWAVIQHTKQDSEIDICFKFDKDVPFVHMSIEV